MQPSHDIASGTAFVILNKPDVTDICAEFPFGERFEEISPVIFEDLWLDDQNIIDTGFNVFHVASSGLKSKRTAVAVLFWSGKRDSTQQSSITSLSDTYFVARVVSVANIEIHCQSYNTTFHLIINISAQNTIFYFSA